MAILPEIVPVRMLAKAAVSKAWIAMPLVPVASIVLAFEMTLTVLARIALPSVPVASMVPALLLIFAVVVWMPNLSPLMTPELELFTVAAISSSMAMPPAVTAALVLVLILFTVRLAAWSAKLGASTPA